MRIIEETKYKYDFYLTLDNKEVYSEIINSDIILSQQYFSKKSDTLGIDYSCIHYFRVPLDEFYFTLKKHLIREASSLDCNIIYYKNDISYNFDTKELTIKNTTEKVVDEDSLKHLLGI